MLLAAGLVSCFERGGHSRAESVLVQPAELPALEQIDNLLFAGIERVRIA